MKVLSVLFGLLAVVLGLAVGLGFMFVGGIIQVLEGIDVEPNNNAEIAWGVARVALAPLAGWLVFFILVAIASLLWDEA